MPTANMAPRQNLFVLAIFAVVFGALALGSYTRKSAVADEPSHLATGYAALRFGDFRTDVEHPPLVRLWAAVPLLFSDVKFDHENPHWKKRVFWPWSWEFLYKMNDADKLLYRARFMIVLLGIGLGAIVFLWARELFGLWPAVVTLGFYTLEPNILTHAGLVTTDMGVTFFFAGTAYFLWRTVRRFSAGNVVGLTVFFVAAQASKFTALVLGPVVLVVLLIRAPRRALVLVPLLAAASYVGLWGVYRFRYLPATADIDPNPIMSKREKVAELAPRLTRVVNWIDQHKLLPHVYSQGFLLGQAKAQWRPAFFCGEVRPRGWWYYFPAAFVFKTPVSLLLLFAAGTALAWRYRQEDIFLIVPPLIYLAVCMLSPINIGLRHLLPVFPFVTLIAGRALSALRVRPVVLALALGFPALELAAVYPDQLAFFNFAAGGPRHGHNLLLDSNIDWGQDLKGLAKWMRAEGVPHVNLSYAGTADPAYYGIQCTYLPGSPFFADGQIRMPELPGFVAISVHHLHGMSPSIPTGFYEPLRQQEPVAVIGHSIHMYWVRQRWWD